MPHIEKFGYSSATTTHTSAPGSSSRARRAALIPASLPPTARRRIGGLRGAAAAVRGGRSVAQRDICQHRVHLPAGIGSRDPDLVLQSMAARDAVLDLGRQPFGREAAGRGYDLGGRAHLDAEVVQGSGFSGVLKEDQLQW